MIKVLIVDDDASLRATVKAAFLSAPEYIVEEAGDGLEAVTKVKKATTPFNMVILDVDMPNLGGLDAMKVIKDFDPRIIVLILTAHSNIEDAVKAVRDGAYNYISKPVKQSEMLKVAELALKAHDLVEAVAAAAPTLTLESGQKFMSGSREMQKVFNIIHKLSKVSTPVLVRGESGTGKELVARAIHYNSQRKNEKIVAINCSAIPETLFESELFGHEKGAFTGADQRKIGKFQYAEGGTLFLDEVGDLSPPMQVKLLRVLQEKKFTPVGANREIESDVRIIAATNRNLEEMIKQGQFREDLFYRLNVIPVVLPPLRERKGDLEHLISLFITKFNKTHGREVTGVTSDSLLALKNYNWPGNIRELENVIEHAFIIEAANKITLKSLPENISGLKDSPAEDNLSAQNEEETSEGTTESPVSKEILDFNKQKEVFEREFIIKALKIFKGRINQTALQANIPKKTLLRKIEKYAINPREYTNSKE